MEQYIRINFKFFYLIKYKILISKTFYIIFLALFSYVMLCEFKYYVENSKNHTTNFNETSSAIQQNKKSISKPNTLEYILMIWIFSFIIEEIQQFVRLFAYFLKFQT